MVDYRDLNNIPEKNSPFCTLPWIHLATHPIGTVTPCCITEMKNGASTAATPENDNEHLFLSKDSLEDITNSKKFNQLRKDMIEGKYSSLCQKCYKYEQGNAFSKRYESNIKFARRAFHDFFRVFFRNSLIFLLISNNVRLCAFMSNDCAVLPDMNKLILLSDNDLSLSCTIRVALSKKQLKQILFLSFHPNNNLCTKNKTYYL